MSTTLRNPRPSRLVLLVPPAVALALSCAGVSLVNVWRDPDYSKSPMKHVLVVAMNHDPATRRLWEDGFVLELGKHGVAAVPSYRPFPDAVPDTEHVVGAVRQDRYDGVLITHRLATETERRYVHGYSTVEPYTVLRPWGRYETYYREVFHHGYTETDRVVRHQTDVWSTAGGDRMVWSGVGEVMDPNSGEAINREIAKRVVPELARDDIIPRDRSTEHREAAGGMSSPGGRRGASAPGPVPKAAPGRDLIGSLTEAGRRATSSLAVPRARQRDYC